MLNSRGFHGSHFGAGRIQAAGVQTSLLVAGGLPNLSALVGERCWELRFFVYCAALAVESSRSSFGNVGRSGLGRRTVGNKTAAHGPTWAVEARPQAGGYHRLAGSTGRVGRLRKELDRVCQYPEQMAEKACIGGAVTQ